MEGRVTGNSPGPFLIHVPNLQLICPFLFSATLHVKIENVSGLHYYDEIEQIWKLSPLRPLIVVRQEFGDCAYIFSYSRVLC